MKFFKKDELRLLWPFYIKNLFTNIFVIYSIFYILYLNEIGLNLTQIGFLISSLALAQFLFEIPTGAVADVFGRKFSTILGYFLSGLIVLSIIFFKDFYSLLFLFFVWGAVETLISGADDAWVVDLLKTKKRKNLIHDFYNKKYSFMSIAGLISGIIGALLVKNFGLGVIWLVTGSSMILSSLVLSFGKEHFVRKKQHLKEQTKGLISHTKKSINYSIKHQAIFIMLIIGIVMITKSVFAGYLTWYPLLQSKGFNNHWFGYLSSLIFAFGIFIPYLTKPLTKKVGSYKKYFIAVSLIMLILLFMVGFSNTLIFLVVIYILLRSMQNFYVPVRSVYFQKFVPSKMRATITSFRGMVIALAGIITLPLAGFVADKIGPQYTIFLGTFILIPAIILYSKIKE